MSTQFWRDLLLDTLRAPGDVGRRLVAAGIPRNTLWQAIVATSAISAILTWISLQLAPLPPQYPTFVSMPMPNFVVEAGGTILMVHVLVWIGRIMGGQGGLDDLLAVMAWLQLVRVLFKSAVLVLMLVAPFFAGLFLMATGLLSLWITLNFIAAAHRLRSLWAALAVLLLSILAIAFAAGMLLGILGISAIGVSAHV